MRSIFAYDVTSLAIYYLIFRGIRKTFGLEFGLFLYMIANLGRYFYLLSERTASDVLMEHIAIDVIILVIYLIIAPKKKGKKAKMDILYPPLLFSIYGIMAYLISTANTENYKQAENWLTGMYVIFFVCSIAGLAECIYIYHKIPRNEEESKISESQI